MHKAIILNMRTLTARNSLKNSWRPRLLQNTSLRRRLTLRGRRPRSRFNCSYQSLSNAKIIAACARKNNNHLTGLCRDRFLPYTRRMITVKCSIAKRSRPFRGSMGRYLHQRTTRPSISTIVRPRCASPLASATSIRVILK
jgi:hypothetical protein